ncbi:PREDICTED: tyrosine-protein kinase Fes/Fps-like [Amphimedon queenslandica]|nr:PREDICTED: tyrosine-protein kinase Fes/Fps-like [Amphimedon queenslandica]|eukprot:XP_003389646.2 PREDICTED: tyrosine-protein kinase Fes/Fps-like [Amphimedon queenslandica]
MEDSRQSSKPEKGIPRHVQVSDLRGQVYDLQDKKSRKQKQLQLIQQAMVPERTDPPPLFDPLGEGADELSTSVAADDPYSTSKPKKGKASETIKRLFKGKGKSKGSDRHESISEDQDRDESTTSGSFSTGGHGAAMEDEEDEYQEPPEVAIEDEPWYYGVMDRRDAEKKCGQAGEYLVRYSDRQNKYVLTVNWNGQGRHFVIQEIPDPQNPGIPLYRFEDKAFGVVRDLLDYHVQTQIPVTRNSGAILGKFISRIDKWSIKRNELQMGRKLGRGAFGEVCEATMSTGEKVAVKTCRDTIPAAEKRKFLQEADILKQYDHPNIVRLIGVCAEKDPVYIIMELLPGGSFLDFLRKKGNHQTKKKLAMMVTDASAGMEYLESMKCIHRDLAARNCLVGESDIVKISDFGMSREEECGIYQVSSGSRQIPIKWTAPEALNLGRYTNASDVWSFGILLWETYSLGSTPYPGMSNNEAREQVEAGYRLPPPNHCPEPVYHIMQECWQYDEDDRPSFAEIHAKLRQAQTQIFN